MYSVLSAAVVGPGFGAWNCASESARKLHEGGALGAAGEGHAEEQGGTDLKALIAGLAGAGASVPTQP